MSVLLTRGTGMETTSVEVWLSEDAQGAATYDDSAEVAARVKREDKVIRTGEGEDVLTTLVLWYSAGASPVPTRKSRVTVGGAAYIAVETKEVERISGALSHTRVRCKDA